MGIIKKFLCFAAIFLIAFLVPMQAVHASSDAIGNVESFNYLEGEQKYLGDPYKDNYSLDMKEVSFSDDFLGYMGNQIQNALNALANVLFKIESLLSYLTVVIFYMCFNLNLADLFGPQVNAIQQALNNSIFLPLFLIGCAAAFCALIGRMLKQDLAGAIGQIVKIIAVVMLSVLVFTKSDTMLTACNNITKEISLEILVGVNTANGYSQDVSDFAAESAGILWRNLVHEPWLSMQFGDTSLIREGEVDQILSMAPGSEERKALIEDDERGCFVYSRAGDRLAYTFFYLIPCIVKCVVYILVAFVQLVFQLLSILYTFMAPLVLIISLFPSYEGILGTWFRKIIEAQISILIISLIIGILVKFDEMIFDWAAQNQYGWMVALAVQIAISVALYMNRNRLLTALSHVQRGVSNPGYLRNRMKLAGNVYQAAPGVARPLKRAAHKTGRAMSGATKNAVKWAGESVNKLNKPVKWTINPFIISQRAQADTEEMGNKAREAGAKGIVDGKERRYKKVSSGNGMAHTIGLTAAGRGSIPRPVAAVVKEAEIATRNERPGNGESLKELADEISRNVSHLASIIESAEDTIREESMKERNGSGDSKRPTFMNEKREREGRAEKAKEITITMKGPDGKEERKSTKSSEKIDIKGHEDGFKGDAARPRFAYEESETTGQKNRESTNRTTVRAKTKEIMSDSERKKDTIHNKDKVISVSQYMKEMSDSDQSV